MIEVTVLDFSPLSSLRFYALQNYLDFDRGAQVNYVGNIYWSDKHSPAGFGPFQNLSDALNHFKRITVSMRFIEAQPLSPPPPLPANVIQVDFKNKKKI